MNYSTKLNSMTRTLAVGRVAARRRRDLPGVGAAVLNSPKSDEVRTAGQQHRSECDVQRRARFDRRRPMDQGRATVRPIPLGLSAGEESRCGDVLDGLFAVQAAEVQSIQKHDRSSIEDL